MATFVSLLPVYLFGNLHCLGMCGPLVAMLGKHAYRYYYFWGRLFSYALAGWLAGELGAVLNVAFSQYHFSAILSLLFGIAIIVCAWPLYRQQAMPGSRKIAGWLAPLNRKLAVLLLRDTRLATFLFGCLTVALPCGQTLLVFSACALSGNPWVGMANGFALALLTSPSLLAAMSMHKMLAGMKPQYSLVMAVSACLIGLLAVLRGLAELALIPHLIIDPFSSAVFHLVIY